MYTVPAMKANRSPKQLERLFKALANHWRIKILLRLAKQPGINLDDLCFELMGNVKTISEHTRKLALAGLIEKKYLGRTVIHTLTGEGESLHRFMETF